MKKSLTILFVSFLICLFVSDISPAQEQYGNIRGKVTDSNKEPLPGVTVTLDCPLYRARSMISSSGGTFRFLNLATGTYSLKCELPGFKTHVEENIIIRVGDNFDFPVILEPATIEEDVTVVATSPIVDTKKTGAAFNVTEVMLQELPSARDPWVILMHIPGIDVWSENVGGSTSGEQAAWSTKGSWTSNSGNYLMDGVNITDMFATGASSRYYDFDSFEEIQVVTTGQNPALKTGGVSINMVTRRGGNKVEFLGRFFFTNDKLQGDNLTQELIDLDYVGNQINQLTDYGFQAGGPILKDKMWFWLGYGVQDIRLLSIDGYPQNTKIESVNGKMNFQLSRKDRGELAFIYNDKSVFSRYVGPRRPPEATYDLTMNGNPLLKLEYEHMFSDTFLTTLKLAYSWGWFGQNPRGGMDIQAGSDLFTGMMSGTADYLRTHRPSYNASLDTNYFIEGFLGGDHEFKFGAEYRLTPTWGDHIWPGGVRKQYYNGEPYRALIHRCLFDSARDRLSFYLNDAYSLGRFTFNFGFRADRENSWANELQVPANPIAPEIMPAYTHPAIDPGVVFWTFQPRIGLTFDLTGDGKTIFRANIGRYSFWPPHLGGQLAMTEENQALYFWDDLNGDDFVSTDELVGYPYDGLLFYNGFDAFNPTSPVSPYEIDPNLKCTLTDELFFGVERELFKDFSLGAHFTIRKNYRITWWIDFNRETGQKDSQENWEGPFQGSITVDGKTYDYEYWAPITHFFELPNSVLENTPELHKNHTSLEVVATKRLSHRWMMNASFSIQKNSDHFGQRGYLDPTNIKFSEGADSLGDPIWMAKINFLYQLPWGFNFSGFAHIRDGWVWRQYIRVYAPERAAKGLGGWMSLDVEKQGETRLANFYNVDLSLSKDFILGRYGRLTVQVDAFNVFNFDHDIWRVNRINSPYYNEIDTILNPRVIRLGVRYRF
jgi:hypothetical protein